MKFINVFPSEKWKYVKYALNRQTQVDSNLMVRRTKLGTDDTIETEPLSWISNNV